MKTSEKLVWNRFKGRLFLFVRLSFQKIFSLYCPVSISLERHLHSNRNRKPSLVNLSTRQGPPCTFSDLFDIVNASKTESKLYKVLIINICRITHITIRYSSMCGVVTV